MVLEGRTVRVTLREPTELPYTTKSTGKVTGVIASVGYDKETGFQLLVVVGKGRNSLIQASIHDCKLV